MTINPPVPPDLDLRHFDCMHLDTVRLLNADIWDECTLEEIAIALRLWAQAWRQVPCSSLPDDDKKLRRLAGLEGKPRLWKKVKSGALRGFEVANDRRMYHAVIAETAIKAAGKSRAGKKGARSRWKDNPLVNNDTSHATAYSNTDGRMNGKRHGRMNGRMDAEKRIESTPTPKPGDGPTGYAEATPARPHDHRPAYTEDHGVEDAEGRICVHYPARAPMGKVPDKILWIAESGNVDCVSTTLNPKPLGLEKPQVLALRDQARSWRARNPLKPGTTNTS